MINKFDYYSNFMSQKPNLISGISRVMDLGCTYNTFYIHDNSYKADKKMLKSDWTAIGADILFTLNKISSEIK